MSRSLFGGSFLHGRDTMIDYVEYRYCIWDGLPIGESPVFQALKFEHGVKVANRYARRMVTPMNHPPPGVQHDIITRTDMVDDRPLA